MINPINQHFLNGTIFGNDDPQEKEQLLMEVRKLLNGSIFFDPDDEMVDWIIEYANGRIIVDAGCGEHLNLTKKLLLEGQPVIAVDPFINEEDLHNFYKWKIDNNLISISGHVLPGRIDRFSRDAEEIIGHGNLIKQLGNRVLIIFARPCHSQFVENTIDYLDPDVESLYITIPGNFDKYNDLGKFRGYAKRIFPKQGTSKDNEEFYSIIK